MYKLYFKLAYQNLLKNYQNTFINLLGLTLGLASALFIFLFYIHETNFDNFYTDNIYRIYHEVNTNGNRVLEADSNYPEGNVLYDKIDNITDFILLTSPEKYPLYINGIKYEGLINLSVSPNFLTFFEIDLINATNSTHLNDQESVLISETTAKRIFGSQNPIGVEIEYYGDKYIINGIFKNQPINSHLQFDVLFSTNHYDSRHFGWYGGVTFNLFVKIKHSRFLQNTTDNINSILEEVYHESSYSKAANLQPIQDLHLHDLDIKYEIGTIRNHQSLYFIIVVGILILILSLMNFIILYTSQKDDEMKSLSLMRIYGAQHNDLIISSGVEIMITVFISIIYSYVLLNVFLPFLNHQLNTTLLLSKNIVQIIIFYIVIGSLITLFLSFFTLRKVKCISLAKSIQGYYSIFSSSNKTDKILLAFQFSIVFILLFFGSVIYQQNNFLLQPDIGYDYNHMSTITFDQYFPIDNKDSFKEVLLKINEVKSVAYSSQLIGGDWVTQNGYYIGDASEEKLVKVIFTDVDFLETFGIPLKQGFNLDKNKKISIHQVLVNEEFTKLNEWNGLGTKIRCYDHTYEVIGVIPSIHFESLLEKNTPLIISTNPSREGWSYNIVNIKLSSTNMNKVSDDINKVVASFIPDINYSIIPYTLTLQKNYEQIEKQKSLSLFFFIITFIISFSGLLGVTRLSVLYRKKEVSLRRVNGASRRQIILLFNKSYLQWILLSFIIAIPIANYFTKEWLSSFPNRIEINYFWWFILGGFISLLSIITITKICWKVVNTNPSEVLRDL